MTKKMFVLGLVLVTSSAFTGTAHAVEMADGVMMKKDDAKMQEEALIQTLMKQIETLNAQVMMQKEKAMKKGDAMMEKKNTVMAGDQMMKEVDLYQGSRGDGVSKLQMFLEERGFLNIPAGVAKGYFGVATKVALMKYQTSVGINATGYFGPLSRVAWKRHMGAMKGDAMKKSDAMMKGDTMMKKDGAMMEKKEVMKEKKDAMMEKKEVMMEKKGSYEAYGPEKLSHASSGKVVLFFRASWCPNCRGVDTDIRANLGKIPAGVVILDVDYDTATALKQKYGVTYQHTFVQVDASGNQITKWTASPTLASLLLNIK